MFAGVQKALAWFVDGLTEAIADLSNRIGKRVPMRLIDVGDGAYAIEQAGGKRDDARLKIAKTGDTTRFQPPDTAHRLVDRDIDLVLPADELLVRTLDPLPAESRQYLDGIVRHQLERFVPWRSDNVLYSYEVAPVGGGDDRLVVRVAATARTLHASLIEAAASLNPRKLRLLYRGAGQSGGDIAIAVDDGTSAASRLRRLRSSVVAALAVLILISAGTFGYLAYAWQQAGDELSAAEQAEAALRRQIGGRGSQETPATRDLRAILARKSAQPSAVLAIEQLSSALPDDTWLSDLQVVDGQMRVTGTSQSVSELVPAVQRSPIFAEATFFSPTTRLANDQGDRFHLQMRLVPPKAVAK